MVAHQPTAYQKAEKLFSSEPLGTAALRLLSEMLEVFHPGEEQSRLFAMLFLCHFPKQSFFSSKSMTTRMFAPW